MPKRKYEKKKTEYWNNRKKKIPKPTKKLAKKLAAALAKL